MLIFIDALLKYVCRRPGGFFLKDTKHVSFV
jgi:hypothetical protein